MHLDNALPINVQMQYLRPRQLEDALRRFPVVYVPFGLIEWHGRHLPVGNDSLKSHAILVKCAEQFGGVVYPSMYFPYAMTSVDKDSLHPEESAWKIEMLTALFDRIKALGARVIVGVSGHNTWQQIAMINRALEPVVADGTIAGIGLWEHTLSRCDESDSDHAAKWETSNMMFFYPELVDMAKLGTGPLVHVTDWAGDIGPDGIGGLDPREHASAEVGRRNVELAVDAMGRKAQELLESLPEDQRAFRLKEVRPESWWSV